MACPDVPPSLRGLLRDKGLEDLYRYLAQDFFHWITTRFDTSGDVLITTIGRGVIIASPNGQRWQITVDNAGAIHTVAL